MPDTSHPQPTPAEIAELVKRHEAGAAALSRRLREELERAGIPVPTPPDGPDAPDPAVAVLDRVEAIVVRELGSQWRRVVRPFGALSGWGDNAGQPLTLADAVEHIAADRVQWRTEAEAAHRSASEATEQARAASSRARDALTQVQEIRRLLDDALRPNATAISYCDDCDVYSGATLVCEAHESELPEPPLSQDLAAEVLRLVMMWREARAATWGAKRGRVSVYVDGDLVTGPDVIPDVGDDVNPTTGSGKSGALDETLAGLPPTTSYAIITGKAPHPEPVDAASPYARRPAWWVAVGSLADYAEAVPAYAADYELRVERGVPERIRDLRPGPPPDRVEAAVYCGATCVDAGRTYGCVMLYGHQRSHVARDDQGRYREFHLPALSLPPLGTSQWTDHDRLTYRGEEYVVLVGAFGAVDGRRTLLYPDGSRRVVQLDAPPDAGPGEIVKL